MSRGNFAKTVWEAVTAAPKWGRPVTTYTIGNTSRKCGVIPGDLWEVQNRTGNLHVAGSKTAGCA